MVRQVYFHRFPSLRLRTGPGISKLQLNLIRFCNEPNQQGRGTDAYEAYCSTIRMYCSCLKYNNISIFQSLKGITSNRAGNNNSLTEQTKIMIAISDNATMNGVPPPFVLRY